MIRRLTILLLIVGCGTEPEEVLENCVLVRNYPLPGPPYVLTQYKCYEDVYTKKECMDKEVDDYSYNSYITESCSEFCSNTTQCSAY